MDVDQMPGNEIIIFRGLELYYTDEYLDKITDMGVMSYSVEKIINVLKVKDPTEFQLIFKDETSRIRRAYQKGVDQAEFIIDQQLLRLVRSGDMDAMKMFEERKADQQLTETKNREKEKWQQKEG
jgi:hypothetical protein